MDSVMCLFLASLLLLVILFPRRESFSSAKKQCIDQGNGQSWCSDVGETQASGCSCSGGMVAYNRYGRCYCMSNLNQSDNAFTAKGASGSEQTEAPASPTAPYAGELQQNISGNSGAGPVPSSSNMSSMLSRGSMISRH